MFKNINILLLFIVLIPNVQFLFKTFGLCDADKIDPIKQLQKAENLLKQLDHVKNDTNAIADVLNNLVATLEPIGEGKEEYKEIRDAVDGILEYSAGFATHETLSPKRVEKMETAFRFIVDVFQKFVVKFEYTSDASTTFGDEAQSQVSDKTAKI